MYALNCCSCIIVCLCSDPSSMQRIVGYVHTLIPQVSAVLPSLCVVPFLNWRSVDGTYQCCRLAVTCGHSECSHHRVYGTVLLPMCVDESWLPYSQSYSNQAEELKQKILWAKFEQLDCQCKGTPSPSPPSPFSLPSSLFPPFLSIPTLCVLATLSL